MNNQATTPAPKEAERLSALKALHILDTAPEAAFDALAQAAAEIFGAASAAISLIDAHRVWLKAKRGWPLSNFNELDRGITFFGNSTIATSHAIAVEDTLRDARFANLPFVVGPEKIRFYAGAPIKDENGYLIGAVTVIDQLPRGVCQKQLNALAGIAQAAMSTFKARRHALERDRQGRDTDPLTGVMSRMVFQQALATRHREASQMNGALGAMFEQADPVGLLRVDLDSFQNFNEGLGHRAGDEVIQALANCLREHLAPNELLARLDGDEFALIMPNGSTATDAVDTAQRMLKVVNQNIRISGGRVVRMSVSIGVACADPSKVSAEALLNRAGSALELAKVQDKQRWALYQEDTHSPKRQWSRTTRGTAEASTMSPLMQMAAHGRHTNHPIDRTDQNCPACIQNAHAPFDFTIAFQPMVDVSRRAVFGYEALVRGKHGEPAHTVLSRVNRRNRYAFDQNCRRMAIEMAHKLKLTQSGAALCINFIPGSILDPGNAAQSAMTAASKAGFPLRNLILEMVETEEVIDVEHLKQTFEIYRRKGFQSALGGFGSGHANLSLLAEFQPSIIKIDRKLIGAIHTSKAKQSIVRGIVDVCRDLDILPIAQGVEQVQEYQALREIGLNLFQGHLFAAPEVEELPPVSFPD